MTTLRLSVRLNRKGQRMFRYGFFLMIMMSFLGACATDGSDNPDSSNVSVVTDTMGVDEEDAGEPSLEEPSDSGSQAFEAGEPPLTEASLQEEDSDEAPAQDAA
jgi:hypothetical protein